MVEDKDAYKSIYNKFYDIVSNTYSVIEEKSTAYILTVMTIIMILYTEIILLF